MPGNATLSRAVLVPLRLVVLMWLIYLTGRYFNLNFIDFGILPRTIQGFPGIITSPLIHGSELHLLSNTFPFLFLGTTLFLFYPKLATGIYLQCYFITGILVWIFARQTFHIGASGMIYGVASFLMFYGLFRKDFKSLVISIIAVVLYGSIFYGILPTQQGVSYESHLMGAIVGLFNAVRLGRKHR